MDTNAVAKEMLLKVEGLKDGLAGVTASIKGLIDKAVELFSGPILECADENEFLNLAAALGDELYQGNVITEAVDGPAIRWILGTLDKNVLDKFAGPDWFAKLQAKAKAFQDAVDAGTAQG